MRHGAARCPHAQKVIFFFLKSQQESSSRPLFAHLFTQDAFGRVFSSSNKYTPAGQTSTSRCSPPPTLQNGYHKPAPSTAGGAETIEYFCNKPYILSGSRRITCSSHGSWSSRQPKCVRGSAWVGLEGWGWGWGWGVLEWTLTVMLLE